MKPEILQAIKGRRKSANMDTISAAVRAYPDHNADDAFFAEWVGDDIDALVAEVERLRIYEKVVDECVDALWRTGWYSSVLELQRDVESLLRQNAVQRQK